jgi:pimeloyl-ACP methyl ester carboxylesterase
MTKEKSRLRTVGRVIGAVFAVLVIIVLVGPFLVPVRDLENLVSARALARPDSVFVNVPFSGTDGVEMHYVERSSDMYRSETSRTFVLLHGSMFSLSTWDGFAGGLSEYGRVIAYDQIPYGLSEKLQEGDWDGQNPYEQSAAVARLVAFLDALGLDRVTLVGHSYGGTLATRAAIEHPDRVAALVLVAPAVYASDSMPGWLLQTPQLQRLGPLLARSLATSETFFRMCYADPDEWTAEKAAATTVHTSVAGWDGALWAYLQAWNNADTTWVDRLSSIGVPTLVIAGAEDAVVPVEDSQRVAEQIPGAEYTELESIGHMVHEEAPLRTTETIASWLGDAQ